MNRSKPLCYALLVVLLVCFWPSDAAAQYD